MGGKTRPVARRGNLERSTRRGKRGSVFPGHWMVTAYDLGQPIGRNMRIDLGRGDICMTEQGLDHAKVCPSFQKVGCKGVSQDMRADPGRVDASVQRRLVQHLGEPARGQMAGA